MPIDMVPAVSAEPIASTVQNPNGLPQLRRENITTRIYRELRTRIMAGHFRPGETLTLRSIAESMGVSQTPVREALLQLTSEHVLSVLPGRSVRVPELSRFELEELGLIRTSLECLAARHAVSRQSPALIESLMHCHDQLVKFKRQKNVTALLEYNLKFHFALYAESGLPTLVATIEGFWARTGPYICFLYQDQQRTVIDPHPHLAIIDGLKRKDSALVERALSQDIQENWKVLVKNAFNGELQDTR